MKTKRLLIAGCLLTVTLLAMFLISSPGMWALDGKGSAVAAPAGGSFTANLPSTDNLASSFGSLPIPAKIVFTYPEPPMSGPQIDTNIWIMDADGSHRTQLTTYTGPDLFPVISPDGSKIAYMSDRNGLQQLWLMNSDGSNPIQMPVNGDTQILSWSPDSQQIAYQNDSQDSWEIWVINADGSNPHRITTTGPGAGHPSWSPDGKKIIYEVEPSTFYLDLYTVNSDGTGSALLLSSSTTGYSYGMPAWSPDGGAIATVRFPAGSTSGPFELWVMNADGSNGHSLVPNIDHLFVNRISWSADGNWLVFSKDGQIWKVRRDGTQLTQLTLEGGWEPWISGELAKSTCVPQSNEADIMMIVDRSGSMATDNKLDDAKTAATAFLSSTNMPPDQVGLVSFASDATLDQVLTTDKASVISATQILSAAGGTRMDYALMTARAELTSTRHISTHSEVIILLTDGVQNPAGNDPVIAEANAAKAESATLFTIGLGPDVDAALLQQIASDPSDYYFAPTGAQLAAIYQQISGAIGCPEIGGQVYVDRDKNGVYSPGTDTPMSNVMISLVGSGVQQTASQADGHYVFANNSAGLYTVLLNLTSVPTGYTPISPTVFSINLTSTDSLANNFGLLPPSPGKIAFTYPEPLLSGPPTLDTNIWIMDVDGSNQTQVTTYTGLDALPTISPDGSKIAYMSYRDGLQQLWLMNSDGSNPIQMPFNGNSQRTSWSPQGDQLAVTNDSQDWWEIWIINADGSNPHRITTTGPAAGEPSWSPDGKKIVYDVEPSAGYQDNYIVNSDGTGQPRQISNSASSGWSTSWPAWSSDGMQIAVGRWPAASSGPYDLWLMNTDGSNGHTLVQNIDPMAYNRISWSVDGNWLIFSKGGQIWKVRRDGTQLTQLTLDGGWEPSINGSLPDLNTGIQHVYLPLMSLNYCADFFDDFSNSASGWFVGSDSNVQTQYLSGEYRVYTSNGNYIYLFRSPSCSRTNYTAETDMRWASATTSGDGYGLLFGVTSSFSNYYMFYVSPDYGDFALLRSDASGYHYIQNFTSSAAIHQGAASNHLKVTRNGSAITLEVNGTILGTWYDSNITGLTAMGLFSNPYTNRPNSDARFDNFSAKTIYAGPLFISPTESGREPAGNRPSSLDHGLDKPQIARDR